ncbi:uncharacterized protein MKS88_000153 [Plasmodium brasilianum]|uniref:uncharacterized protein n=1 Tax=Plasmodium brasilianum TaxID=5824 RepID=UPI00350E57C4|nr:hypothetical protein MKS88_000153 [Plasmodium brasilianum]
MEPHSSENNYNCVKLYLQYNRKCEILISNFMCDSIIPARKKNKKNNNPLWFVPFRDIAYELGQDHGSDDGSCSKINDCYNFYFRNYEDCQRNRYNAFFEDLINFKKVYNNKICKVKKIIHNRANMEPNMYVNFRK